MPITKIDIEGFLERRLFAPIIDVRSPAEFAHAHIAGAYNLSLFNDEERKIVGTAFKQQSREDAIKIGLQFFGPKMAGMIEFVEDILEKERKLEARKTGIRNKPSDKTVMVHCWRGGMRSAGIAWLLDLYGFKVYLLVGGYKSFRQWCHQQFDSSYQLNILGGFTGSGKTETLKALQVKNELVLDLEGLANHKGSSFGSIGMPEQPAQEMFENLLALRLHELQKSSLEISEDNLLAGIDNKMEQPKRNAGIWVEDESQRIGNLNIPTALWQQMRSSSVCFMDIPFEPRLEYLVKDYGKGDKEKLMSAILRIAKRLGGQETKSAVNLLLEDNLKECFRILLSYYDKHYLKGLQNRDNWQQRVHYVSCHTVDIVSNTNKLLQHHKMA